MARWSANNYTISFDVNGATNINSYSSSIDYDAEIKYPSLVRTGYEFLGWYYNDVLFNDKNFKNENDVNLVAKWKAYDYVITLNTDGGTLDIDNIKVVYGEALNIPSPTKTGYTFTGWYYKNNKYESTNYYELSDIELLAKWEANSYTISFDVDGANNASNYSESIKYDAKINYPNLVKTGYEFQGWLYNEVLFNDEYYNELNNITLVADWKVCEYTITLNADGGDIGYSEIIREYGASIDLPTPIKTGYTFNGWFYKNDKFNDVVYYRTEDIILDARWTANTYTVTYNVNGGDSLGYSSKEVTYDGYITLPSPLRTGYTFTGWYYGSVLFDSVVYKETSSITIEAHWDANEYNLVMGDYIKKVTYDSAVGELYSIPNKTGYNATSSWLIDGNPIDSSYVLKYTTDNEAVVTDSHKT